MENAPMSMNWYRSQFVTVAAYDLHSRVWYAAKLPALSPLPRRPGPDQTRPWGCTRLVWFSGSQARHCW
jgi:hypothetical protein